MRGILSIRDVVVRVGLPVALILTQGCDAGTSTPNASPASPNPNGSPETRALEDLKKDLKPPVVVKPNIPPGTDAVPVAPKRD